MQRVTLARNQIGPLLDQLISELDANGCATQRRYFNRIRGEFNRANDEWDLTTSIVELTASPAMGLQLPDTADALMVRILEKASVLITELEGANANLH